MLSGLNRFQRADPVLHFFPVLGAQDKPSERCNYLQGDRDPWRWERSRASHPPAWLTATDNEISSFPLVKTRRGTSPPTPRLLIISSLTATSTPQVFSSRLVSDAWARFRLTGGESEKMLKACFITEAASMRVNPCAFNIAIIYW